MVLDIDGAPYSPAGLDLDQPIPQSACLPERENETCAFSLQGAFALEVECGSYHDGTPDCAPHAVEHAFGELPRGAIDNLTEYCTTELAEWSDCADIPGQSSRKCWRKPGKTPPACGPGNSCGKKEQATA